MALTRLGLYGGPRTGALSAVVPTPTPVPFLGYGIATFSSDSYQSAMAPALVLVAKLTASISSASLKTTVGEA